MKNFIFILLCWGLMLLKITAQRVPTFAKNYTTQDGLPSNTVYQITQDQEGFLWFATDGGVSKFDGRNFENLGAKDGLRGNEAFDIGHHKDKVWFRNFLGIFFYDIKKKAFCSDSINIFFENELKNEISPSHLDSLKQYFKTKLGDDFNNVFEDHEHNYWLCFKNKGIFFYPNKNIIGLDIKEESLLAQHFTHICQNQNGYIAAANINQDVYIFDKKNTLLKVIKSKEAIEKGKIKKILFDHDDLYLQKDSRLYHFFDILKLKKIEKKFQDIRGKSFCIDTVKNRLMTIYKGFEFFDKNTFDTLAKPKEISDKNLFAIAQQSENMFWTGGVAGLFVYNAITQRLDTLNEKFNDSPIKDIIVLDEKWVLVATSGSGVYLIDNQSVVKKWTSENGLKSDNCSRLFRDGNIVWILSNNGLDAIDLSNNYAFFLSNLQFGSTINDLTAKNGKVHIATIEGIFTFHISDLKPYQKPPILYVHTNFGTKDTLQITDNQPIEFYFKGIAFQNGERLWYKYDIFKKDFWGVYRLFESTKDSAQQEGISARSFPEGDYRLAVSCRRLGNNMAWSAEKYVFFSVKLPFYRNFFAKTIYFTLFLSAIFAFYAYWLKRRGAKKIALQKERLELEHKALRSQMNPHFIFNSLGTAEKFFLNHETEEGLDYLADMASLMRQMLENSKHTLIPLSNEIDFLQQYMRLEEVRHNFSFQFKMIFEDNIQDFSMMIPPMMVQPFLENAVKYGISTKHSESKITLTINELNHFLILNIEDNGQGINVVKARNSTRKHQSNAIEITQKRLALMQNKEGKKGELTIIDKSDTALENNKIENQGTLITIKIPLI